MYPNDACERRGQEAVQGEATSGRKLLPFPVALCCGLLVHSIATSCWSPSTGSLPGTQSGPQKASPECRSRPQQPQEAAVPRGGCLEVALGRATPFGSPWETGGPHPASPAASCLEGQGMEGEGAKRRNTPAPT